MVVHVPDSTGSEPTRSDVARYRLLCGAVSFVVVFASFAVAYSLILRALAAVPELAGAVMVYLAFTAWAVVWLALTAGVERASESPGR